MTEANSRVIVKAMQSKKHSTKRLTTTEFIARARDVHGKKYEYPNTNYINSKTKVEVLCLLHGVFYVEPNSHLMGRGCSVCGEASRRKSRTKTTEWFIAQAFTVHGYKYDYSESIYTHSKIKLKIKCIDCDLFFFQSSNHHLKGHGCAHCAKKETASKNRKTLDAFIVQANKIHGLGRYDYSKSSYTSAVKPLLIGCNECGVDFRQTPNIHLSNHGCPDCAKNLTGWNKRRFKKLCENKNRTSSFYLIKCFNENEVFYKIGITSTSIKSRFPRSAMPYKYKELLFLSDTPEVIWGLEKTLIKALKDFRYSPKISFNGETECFSERAIDVIRSLCDQNMSPKPHI